MKLNSIQEIIEDISQGKMVILMDDEDRENEGDLVLAAELVDAEAINFMATHARGLICLAINEDRCKTSTYRKEDVDHCRCLNSHLMYS